MTESNTDYNKKVQDLKYVRSQMIKLGNILTEIDSQHRKIILEPKFQEKVEKLLHEAHLLNEWDARATGRDPMAKRISPDIRNTKNRPGPSRAEKTNADSYTDSRNPERSNARKVNKGNNTDNYNNYTRTRSVGVGPQFSSESEDSTNEEPFVSSASDEFPRLEWADNRRQSKVHRNQYVDSKFDQHHKRLNRIENNFNILTRKLDEIKFSKSKHGRPIKSKSGKRRKVIADQIRIWKVRANRICDIMGLDDLEDYTPDESENRQPDELDFWKHRATKLFDRLVKLKHADIRVWKAAEQYIDFDEALDILNNSKRKHRKLDE